MSWIELPRPYPDEILYSVIARWVLRTGLTSDHDISMKLFGRRSHTVSIQMPSYLRILKKRLKSSFTVDYLVENTTLFRYYATFMTPEKQAEVRNLMLDDNPRNALRSIVDHSKALYCCPQCVVEDVSVFGESYWHRVHQIPGVFICPKHNAVLLGSCPVCGLPFETTRPEYVITPTVCSRGHDLTQKIVWNTSATLLTVAKDSLFVLEGGMQHIGLKFLNESYREWINQTGQYKWQHRGLNVDLDRERYIRTDYYDIVRQEFVTRFGSAYLDTVNASLRPEDEVEGQYDSWRFIGYFPRNGWHRPHDWLYRLFFHQPRQYDIPIKHILLMEFIAGNVVNFVNGRNVLTDAASFLQSMQEAAATQGEDS